MTNHILNIYLIMILTKKISITINANIYQYYNNLGYNCKCGDKIKVNVCDLSKGSSVKIEVECDMCGIKRNVRYNDYNKNFEKYKLYTCLKCSSIKNKKTNLEKYGYENCFANQIIKDKIKKTNIEKYGVEYFSQTLKWKNLMINPDKNNYYTYRNRIDNLTKKAKNDLFENWNGYDYYDNEYIKNNLSLNHNNNGYPSIDHKITCLYGFLNNIPAEEIANICNLCITKRSINSSKKDKNEIDFNYAKY